MRVEYHPAVEQDVAEALRLRRIANEQSPMVHGENKAELRRDVRVL